MITKWLRGSGLVVNESKTEVCVFHKTCTEGKAITIVKGHKPKLYEVLQVIVVVYMLISDSLDLA